MTYPRLIHWLNFRQLCKALSEKILLHLELEKPSLCFLKKFICSFQMPIRNTVLTEWQIDTVSLQIWVINVLLFGQLYFQLETVRGQYLTQDFQAQTVEQRNSTVFSSLCSCCFVKKKVRCDIPRFSFRMEEHVFLQNWRCVISLQLSDLFWIAPTAVNCPLQGQPFCGVHIQYLESLQSHLHQDYNRAQFLLFISASFLSLHQCWFQEYSLIFLRYDNLLRDSCEDIHSPDRANILKGPRIRT